MNQLCKVCGEPAAGFHFGAFTCEGCKSFFGRSYNNLSVISECKNGGQCVINKKNRTSCKACRLRKCLLVGMSKSGSRYGRRSNWFKLHCLMQEQAPSSTNNETISMPSPAFHGLRRSFHPHGLINGVNNLHGVPSSMSSNESKDDVEECKNSSSPSVSSPESHHSDSSLEMEAKNAINLNPYGLKLGGSLTHASLYEGKDFFPPLTMPMLPHLQAAAAAAAAAAANLHNQHLQGGFFPPNLPAPRLLFPGMNSIAFPTTGSSSPRPVVAAKSVEGPPAKKFNIESMLQHTKSSAQVSVATDAEQESPMDLSVKKETRLSARSTSHRDEQDSDIEFDESDTLNDEDDDNADEDDAASDSEGCASGKEEKKEHSHPLDLTRK